MAVVAQWGRRAIGVRTREGLAAKRAAGARLGRPQVLTLAMVTRVVSELAAGQTLQAVADGLMTDAVPTARGGASWRPSSVEAVLRWQAAA